MKNYFKLSLLTVLLILLAGPMKGFAQMKTLVDVSKSFSNITKIEVTGGSLEIEYVGGEQDDVMVNAFLESNFHDQDIIFVTAGNILKISHKMPNTITGVRNMRTKGHIKISGPKEMDVDFKGGSGSLLAENIVANEVNLTVGSGRIKGHLIEGNVSAKAGSGSINLSQIDGNVQSSVGSGRTEIMDIDGNVNYKASSGSLKAKNVMGILEVSITSGSARLENIEELGALKMTSGNINASNAGLSNETSFAGTSGNFNIQTPSDLRDFNFALNSTSGNLTVGNSKSRRSLSIDNGAPNEIKGSITSGNISIQN
jgi:lia operon protein LiaG